MKIGFVVEGDGEYASLPHVSSQLRARTGHTILNPLKATFDPQGPVGHVVSACLPQLRILRSKGVNLAVVLLDQETRARCPRDVAGRLAREFSSRGCAEVAVVVKSVAFENWLISDLGAIDMQPRRFTYSESMRRQVEPNKVDGCDAVSWLSRAATGAAYHKVLDSERILSRADVGRMAGNSRSFRRLLRVIGDPAYAGQSRAP